MSEQAFDSLDIADVDNVEVLIRADADAIWINVDGVCRLRVQKVKHIFITDESPRKLIEPMPLFRTHKTIDGLTDFIKVFPKDRQITLYTMMYMTWNFLASQVNVSGRKSVIKPERIQGGKDGPASNR